MKFIKGMLLSIFLLFVITIQVEAKYVRENNFMDKKGSQRIAEIKKFQAYCNLPVTGKLDNQTSKMLYTENMLVVDEIAYPPSNGPWIAINKTNRSLTMYNGNKVLFKFPVALGTSKTPTPSGKGTIRNKVVNPAWGGMNGKYPPAAADDPKNPLGERWMGLNLTGFNGYGIHGTILPKQIGGYVSNGCIRMFNYDIENYIFPNAKVGMPVWLGTTEELKSWGLTQDLIEIKQEISVPNKTENLIDETKEVENYQTDELLVF